MTVEKTINGNVPRLIEREGPTGLISTTTGISLHSENETRLLSIQVKDDRSQTQKILAELAKHATGEIIEKPDLSRWHALQSWLEIGGERNVVIPYADTLAEKTTPASVRMRRDFEKILILIRSCAMLYQCQRLRDSQNRIIASLEDYSIVHDLVFDAISEASETSISKIVRETVLAVRKLLEGKSMGESISIQQLTDFMQLDKSSVSRRVKSAISLGHLVNQEERPGRHAKIILGAAMPEDVPALPRPDDLRTIIQEIPPEIAATLQHLSKVDKSKNMSDIIQAYLDEPHCSPDKNCPCPACHQIAWRERSSIAGGGLVCGICHPDKGVQYELGL